MNPKIKRSVSLLLAILMLFGMLPVNAAEPIFVSENEVRLTRPENGEEGAPGENEAEDNPAEQPAEENLSALDTVLQAIESNIDDARVRFDVERNTANPVKTGDPVQYTIFYNLGQAPSYMVLVDDTAMAAYTGYKEVRFKIYPPKDFVILNGSGEIIGTEQDPYVYKLKDAAAGITGNFFFTGRSLLNGLAADGEALGGVRVEMEADVEVEDLNLPDSGKQLATFKNENIPSTHDTDVVASANAEWGVAKKAAKSEPEVFSEGGEEYLKFTFFIDFGLEQNGVVVNDPALYTRAGMLALKPGAKVTVKDILPQIAKTALHTENALPVSAELLLDGEVLASYKKGENAVEEFSTNKIKTLDVSANAKFGVLDKMPAYTRYTATVVYKKADFELQFGDGAFDDTSKLFTVQNKASATFERVGDDAPTTKEAQASVRKKYELEPARIRVSQQVVIDGITRDYTGNVKKLFPGAKIAVYEAGDWDDAAGKPREGAAPKFESTFDGNADTYLETPNLPAGDYVAVQVERPENMVDDPKAGRAQHIAVKPGETGKVGFVNPMDDDFGMLRLRKVNDAGHPMGEVGFLLRSKADGTETEVRYTDLTGEVDFFVRSGAYTLHEEKAPDGFVRIQPIDVTVEGGKINVKHFDAPIKNIRNTGKLVIRKFVSEYVSAEHTVIGLPKKPNIDQFDDPAKFTFALARSSDGEQWESVNDSISLDKDGTVYLDGLDRADAEGTYYTYKLKENDAPQSFLAKDNYEYSFTFTADTQFTADFFNTVSGAFRMKKVFKENGPDGAVKTETKSGVGYKLYKKLHGEASYELMQDDIRTDEQGIFTTMLLPIRDVLGNRVEYFLLEDAASLDGHTLSSADNKIGIKTDSGMPLYGPLTLGFTPLTDLASVPGSVMENRENTGALRVYKTEEGKNERLSGAKFKVYTMAGGVKEYLKDDSGDRVFETPGNADAVLIDLPFGTYYVEEIEPPKGYMLTAAVQSFTIDRPMQTGVIHLQDKPLPTLEGQKKQMRADTGAVSNAAVPGIVFELYKMENGALTPALNDEGAPITFTTKADGHTERVAIQDYEAEYYIREANVPYGMFSPDDEQNGLRAGAFRITGSAAGDLKIVDQKIVGGPFKVNSGGAFVFSVTNKLSLGTIQLNKVDSKKPQTKLNGFKVDIFVTTDDAATVEALAKLGFAEENGRLVLHADSGKQNSFVRKEGLPLLDSSGKALEYSYIETEPPEEYLLPRDNAEKPIVFDLSRSQGGLFTADMPNAHKAVFRMTKYGFSEFEAKGASASGFTVWGLSGAKFAMYRLDENDRLVFMEEKVSEPSLEFTGLYGDERYFLVETESAPGYRAAPNELLQPADALNGKTVDDLIAGNYAFREHDFSKDPDKNEYSAALNASIRNGRPYAQIQLTKYLDRMDGSEPVKYNFSRFKLYSASREDFDAAGGIAALPSGQIKTDGKIYESGTGGVGAFVTGELDPYRVYWLEEVEAAPGTEPRDGTMSAPIMFSENEFDRIKNVNFYNQPVNGQSSTALQAVQFKLKKLIETDGGAQEPLNDITFDFYVADKTFKKIAKIADLTTGKNKDDPAGYGVGITNAIYINDDFAAKYGPDVVTKNQDGSYTFNLLAVESGYQALLVTPRDGGVYEYTVTTKPLDQGMSHLDTHFFDSPVINDPGVRIPVEIEKRGYAAGEDPASGVLLKGAEIGVFTDPGCTKLFRKRTTSSSGVVRFSLKAQKDYWFKEISAPEGYELNPQIFHIPAQTEKPDKPLHYVINDPKLRELEIVKRDTEGNVVAGALLRVSNADGTPLLDGNKTPGPDGAYTSGGTSFLLLRGDGKYYLNEESLSGRPLSEREKHYFVIANGLSTPIVFGKNEHHKTLNVVNPGLGELTIVKHDTEGVPLNGVEFTLKFKPFKNNTTTQPAGAFGFLEGKTEDTKVTVNGSLTIKNLVPGWYEVTETIPEGFVGTEKHVIPVYGKMLGGDKSGKNTLDITNIPLRYLEITKEFFVLDTETVPEKAVFRLFTDAAGKKPATPDKVEINISANRGSAKVELPVGVYYIREELQKPFRAYVNGQLVKSLVKAEITKANGIDAPVKVAFENKSRWARINLIKTDDKTPATPLRDAEFALYYMNAAGQKFFYQGDDTWAAQDTAPKLWRTEGTGRAEIRFLKPDDDTVTFYLKETRAPAGYVEGDNTELNKGIAVQDAAAAEAHAVNEQGVSITVIKHGMPFKYVKDGEEHLLPGAEITLYEVDGEKVTRLDSRKTTADGEAVFTNLPKLKDGAYYAIEESAFPEGYLKKLEDVRVNGAAVSPETVKGHTLFRVAAAEDETSVHAYNTKAGKLMLLKYNVLRIANPPENLTFTITKKGDAAFKPVVRKVTKVSGTAFPKVAGEYRKNGDYYENDSVMYTAALIDGLEPGTYEITESFDVAFKKNFFYPKGTTAADAWCRTREAVVGDDGEIVPLVFGNLPYEQPKPPALQKSVKASNGEDGVNELVDLQEKEQSLTYTLSGFARPEEGKHFTIPVDWFAVEDTALAFKDTNDDNVDNVTAAVQTVTVGAAKYVSTDFIPDPDNTAPIMAEVYGVAGGQETKVAEVNVQGKAQTVSMGKKYAGFKVVYRDLKPGFTAEAIEVTVNFKQGEDEQNNTVTAIHNTASAYAAYTLMDKQEKTVPQNAAVKTPVVESGAMPKASIAKTGVLVDANGADQPVGGASEYKYLSPGDNVKYTVTAANLASSGDRNLIDPVVLDKLPEIFEPDMSKVTVTAPAGMTPDAPTVKDGYLVCPVEGELKAGESIRVVIPGLIKTTAYDYKGNRVINDAFLISRKRVKVNAANPLGTSFLTDGDQRPPYAIPGGVVGDGKNFDAIKAEDAMPFVNASQVKIFKLASGNVSGLDNYIGGEGYATANPKGEIRYRIVVVNGGQNPISKVRVADIMPFVGDRTMGMTDQRFSRWEVELVSVSVPDGAVVYSSSSGNPSRGSLYGDIDTAVWTAGAGVGAKSVLVDFGDKEVKAGESLTVNITARVKDMDDAALDAAYFLQATNNATMARDLKPGSVSASNLAKVTLVPGTTGVGNRVWVDLNGDGIQQGAGIDDPAASPEEPSYTDGGLSMVLRTYENGVNKSTETASVVNGFYGFENLITGEPKAGQEGNLFDGAGNVRQKPCAARCA